jgi:hypothetical protein
MGHYNTLENHIYENFEFLRYYLWYYPQNWFFRSL